MLLYLAVDGLTSTWQDNMFNSYSMSICNQVHGLLVNVQKSACVHASVSAAASGSCRLLDRHQEVLRECGPAIIIKIG